MAQEKNNNTDKKEIKFNNELEQYMNLDHDEEIIDLDQEESVREALSRTFDKSNSEDVSKDETNEESDDEMDDNEISDDDINAVLAAYKKTGNGKKVSLETSSKSNKSSKSSKVSKSTEKNLEKNTGNNPGKNTGKYTSKNTETNSEKNTGKNSVNPSGKTAGKKREPGASYALMIILALTTFASICLCFILLYSMNKRMEEAMSNQVTTEEENMQAVIYYDQAQVDAMIAQAKENGANEQEAEIKDYIRSIAENRNPNFAEMLRRLYPENIVFLDSDGYHFVPITSAYPASNVVAENLIKDSNDFYEYRENGEVTSKRGIDVSQHQGTIDWQQVADSGIDFAIIRMGFRGYGSGALVEDEQFQANIQGATEAGLEVGVYFFTQAINEEEALEEAQMVLDALEGYTITGPIVLDVEKPDDSSARANALTKEERTALTKLFCQTVEDAGYSSMIYGNLYTIFSMLDLDQIKDYDIWFAFYNDYLYYPYEVKIWQYTANGAVPGVSGAVDVNIMFKTN